jgi:UDPglucose--hexose-1-phosphate uridylyltransferase
MIIIHNELIDFGDRLMSEIRQDPTTYDWIIFSPEREKRPNDFKKHKANKIKIPEQSNSCPFCPGNEHLTPEAEYVYGIAEEYGIRVVPNKYPALKPEGDTKRKEIKLFRKSNGYGRHEVIIESKLHNQLIPFMDDEHVQGLIKVYIDRYRTLKQDPNIKSIVIFKNHGLEAGTSLEHPHSQIIASPIVSPYIRKQYDVATQHFDHTGRCLLTDISRAEIEDSSRILLNSEFFVVFHPFASHYPFETWIMPKIRNASFGAISEKELIEFVKVLKEVLHKLYLCLDDPAYNFIIYTAPVEDELKTYYLWHMKIIPRLIKTAGFELGSGMYTNNKLPEETAAYIRNYYYGGL